MESWIRGWRGAMMLFVAVVVLALALRLIGIGSFMTVDEEQWMLRGGEFYEKLFSRHDPGGTFTTTHPGATTQWLAGAGIFWKESRLGTGVDTSNLRDFRLAATVPVALATAVLTGVIVLLVWRLMGRAAAVWSGVLLAVEPYLVGMSQVVHVDILLALFMLGALLAWLIWRREAQRRWLLLAGVCAGLAFGTKLLPALWILPFFSLMLAADVVLSRLSIRGALRAALFGFGIAVLTFYLVWPALWVKSGLGAYYQRDVVSVATQDHVAVEVSEDPIEPASFYVRSLAGRTTPFVLLVAAGVLVAALRHAVSLRVFRHAAGRLSRHDGQRDENVSVFSADVLWLVVYTVGFLLLITLAAKKADRYALPALAVLPVLAGAGWALVLAMVSEGRLRVPRGARRWLAVAIGLMLVLQPLLWSPYAIAFDTPGLDVRPLSQQGWGEGLDAAARWLNGHPLADRLTVASWYPGVMRTYFDGTTMSLSSRDDPRVGAVVLYRNMGGRAPDDVATDVLEEFSDRTPVHTVVIDGVEYAWVYEMLGLHYFPQHVGELVGGMEVGQIVVAADDGWQGVEIGMATFSSRDNRQDVVVEVKENAESDEVLRSVVVNAAQIADSDWHRFEFEPIEESAGRQFYVAVRSPASRPGDAVTVRFVDRNVMDGEMLLRRRALAEGEKNTAFLRPESDAALRLLYAP